MEDEMKIPRILKIDYCDDCLYCDGLYCKHPTIIQRRIILAQDGKYIPEWCPLDAVPQPTKCTCKSGNVEGCPWWVGDGTCILCKVKGTSLKHKDDKLVLPMTLRKY